MMLELVVTQEDGSRVVHCLPSPILLGRGKECDVPLRSWRVARSHARLYVHDGGVAINDLGSLAGTLVNGLRVVHQGALGPDDEIVIGGYMLQVRQRADSDPGQKAGGGESSKPACDKLEAQASLAVVSATTTNPETVVSMAEAGVASWPTTPKPIEAGVQAQALPVSGEHIEWRRRLHARLLEAIDLRRRDVASMSDAALRAEADALLVELIAQAQGELPAELDRDALRCEVVDEAVGLGPLEALLADPGISEIMVNRYDELFVEQGGRLRRHPIAFSSDRAVLGVIERIVAPLGRRVDESSPMVDARLKDGSRVNAVIAPVALKGAALTIRKFPARRLQIEDLIQGSALDAAMASFLRLCVSERKNIIVSGGTGSGKTTLLNILSNFVPPGERIVTIEDAAELRLHHAHLVSLEARPPNLEGRGAVSIRDLVRNALRMRPDRIVVGECRGPEALDMLQAMNTGHEGSLTTLHANTPRDALARLETMILMAGMDLPLAAIREQLASSIDVIVQQTRSATGARRITAIVEVAGMESGRIQLQELFRFDPDFENGAFRGCGVVPAFYEAWRARGAPPASEIFFGATGLAGQNLSSGDWPGPSGQADVGAWQARTQP